MPSSAHEIAVARLRDDPSLLALLAERLLGRPLPHPLHLADSNIRLANPVEIRPDILFAHGKRGPWHAVEVQRRIDRRKLSRWATLVSILFDQRGAMGDLWVITADARVADWARRGCDITGPTGTVLRVVPVVLLVNDATLDALLDPSHPALAFFAAWAMQARADAEAERTITRALDLADDAPESLRRRLTQDILGVLAPALSTRIEEQRMKRNTLTGHIPIPQWIKDRWAVVDEQKATIKRGALITVLEARGLLAPDDAFTRARIQRTKKLALLDRWIAQSATATTLAEALARTPQKKPRPRAASKRSSSPTSPAETTPARGIAKAKSRSVPAKKRASAAPLRTRPTL